MRVSELPLKIVAAFWHIQLQWKKCGVIVQKLLSEKNISKEKIRRNVFVVYMLN